MAEHYYAEELTAVPFKSLRRVLAMSVPGPLAFGLAAFFRLRGLLRWPLPPTYAMGDLGSERVVAWESLPARALSRWAPLIEQFRDLHFQPLKYSLGNVIGTKEQVAAVFLDAAGSTLVTLEWIRLPGADGIEERTPLEFNSYADVDPEFMTGVVDEPTLALADVLRIAFVDAVLLSDRLTVAEAYRRHLWIQGRTVFHLTPEAALREHERRKARRFAWTVKTGLLRPLTAAEAARVRELRSPLGRGCLADDGCPVAPFLGYRRTICYNPRSRLPESWAPAVPLIGRLEPSQECFPCPFSTIFIRR